MFVEIARTGDYRQLARKKFFDIEECFHAWEEVVQKNNEANGGASHSIFMETYEGYGMLLAEYNIVKAILLKLHFCVDDYAIGFLVERGYRIDTSSSSAYAQSLARAMKVSDNIGTRIKSKLNEIDHQQKEKSDEPTDYDQIVAALNVMLGFAVGPEITLSQYNNYHKALKLKADAMKPKKKAVHVGD